MISSVARLIRLPNLLIIALTMYLVRYCLMQPQLQLQVLDLKMEDVDFIILVLSVIFIAAAGYVINDYFDTRIDAINHPEKVVVGKLIPYKKAIIIHWVLNGLGLLAGVYVAYKVGAPKLAFIHLIATGLLWFYSTSYKKSLLIGNVVVAALSALVPLIAAIFEPNNSKINFVFVLAYAFFAFIISIIREIIKDIEDMKGDKLDSAHTLPIVSGVGIAKIVILFLSLSLFGFLAVVEYNQYLGKDFISFYYFVIAVSLPIAILMYSIVKAKDKNDFTRASMLSKFIMLSGIMSMLIFYLTIKDLIVR